MTKELRINNQIRVPQLQVIDHDGAQLGTMNISDALKLARERDLDLVEVGPAMNPPIAKIMDYGKYKYQKERQKKSGPKQKEQGRKTVRVGFKTGQHDLDFKARKVNEFLSESNIVKVELTLRGREKGLAQMGREKLEQFLAFITHPFDVIDQIRRGPFGWTIIISPKKIK